MQDPPVILFDGDCGMCDAAVKFVMARDGGRFRFAPLSSDAGKKLLADHGIESIDSVVLIEEGKAYQKSTAALLIAVGLTGLWPMLGAFAYVPLALRDQAYDFVARNRSKFPRKDQCAVPTPEQQARFVG